MANRRTTGRHPNHSARAKKRISRPKTSINSQKAKNKKHEPRGKEYTIRQSDATWRVIYGSVRVGGVMAFAYDITGGSNFICMVCSHLTLGVQDLYLNDVKINFGDSPDPRWAVSGTKPDGTIDTNYLEQVFLAYMNGEEDQEAQPDLLAQSEIYYPTKWGATDRLRGISYAYIIIRFNNKVFADGLPEISFQLAGKSDIYDPRTDTYIYTDNAALIIADYLMNTKFGCSVPPERIDMDRLADAADECDEMVTKLDGSEEKRYTINFTFDTDETKQTILEKMLTAIGGSITYADGKWKIWPAVWHAPELTLTESDLRSPVKIKTLVSRRDNFNAIRGTFTSPINNWQVTDFPIVKNDFYESQDSGERNYQEMKYPCTISPSACQRLSKIALEEIRQPIEVSASFGLRALQLEVPDTVMLTLPRYGWTEKIFKVVETELILEESNDSPQLKVDLLLRETAEGVYDWNSGQETNVDLAPNSELPSIFFVPTITGLTLSSGTTELFIRSDGTVFSRIKVSWDAFTSAFISNNGYVDVQFKKSADSDWNTAAPVIAEINFNHILDVQDLVYYDVRVRARNSLGTPGAWTTATNHLVLGKSEPPSDVLDFYATFGSFGIFFKWANILDLDLSHYEIRQSDATLNWDTATFVAEVSGVQYTLDLQVTSEYYFLIKAVDTSGNYSLNATSILVMVIKPSAPVIQHTIVGPNIVLKWTESEGQFSIEDYEIRYGSSFEISTFVTKVKGTTYTLKGSWSGLRRFWIAAHDVAGNTGFSGFRDVQIYPPFAVTNLTAQVIDNNVLFRWAASVGGTLPIDFYNVYKGSILSTAELIGKTSGTFSAYFEIISGDYVYWIVPVDTAGNFGQPTSVGAQVDQPPDFELFEDLILEPALADTLDNIRPETIQGAPVIIPEPPLPGTGTAGTATGLFAPPTYAT